MHERLLTWLRCPLCSAKLHAHPSSGGSLHAGGELLEGHLVCLAGHTYGVHDGVPRLLVADAHDARTRRSFDSEWAAHRPGERTWAMDLDDRVQAFLLDTMRMPRDALEGKLLLDAGCGNGSQSVAYTKLGLEVVALDLSAGVEHGRAYRDTYPGARPDLVHFVQADLRHPPLAPGSFDLIHSAGVLHHTPSTEATFRTLCRLLRDDGQLFVWLYGHEPFVTPVVDAVRKLTTRLPQSWFACIARGMAAPFQLLTAVLDAIGIRQYGRLTRREAELALIDIFGSPYAHTHSFHEVERWFREEGFVEVWRSNDSRRGFGAWGRRRAVAPGGRPAREHRSEIAERS